MASDRLYHVVVGELQMLMTVMRRNRKWKTAPFDYQRKPNADHPRSLMVGFQKLRTSLLPGADLDSFAIATPFIAVVRSEETSGLITALALGALHKLIVNGLCDSGPAARDVRTLAAVAEGANHCRFEATDRKRDELVLHNILHLQVAVLRSARGDALSDAAVWDIVKTCFRIHRQVRPPDYSELLCDEAHSTLMQLTATIFARLNTLTAAASAATAAADQVSGGEGKTPLAAPTNAVATAVAAAAAAGASPHQLSRTGPYGLPLIIRVFEFICTLTDWSHSGVFPPTASSFVGSSAAATAAAAAAAAPATTNTTDANTTSPATVASPTNASAAAAAAAAQNSAPAPGPIFDPTLSAFNESKLHRSGGTASGGSGGVEYDEHDAHGRTMLTAHMLLTALETSADALSRVPVLLNHIEDAVCRFIARCARSNDILITQITLRMVYNLFVTPNLRAALPLQMEVLIQTVFIRPLKGDTRSAAATPATATASAPTATSGSSVPSASIAYDLKEMVLESLLDLCRLGWFFPELYINYDCNPHATSIGENLFQILSKTVFPSSVLPPGASAANGTATLASTDAGSATAPVWSNAVVLSGNHVLALKCLVYALNGMQQRAGVWNSLRLTNGAAANNAAAAAVDGWTVTSAHPQLLNGLRVLGGADGADAIDSFAYSNNPNDNTLMTRYWRHKKPATATATTDAKSAPAPAAAAAAMSDADSDDDASSGDESEVGVVSRQQQSILGRCLREARAFKRSVQSAVDDFNRHKESPKKCILKFPSELNCFDSWTRLRDIKDPKEVLSSEEKLQLNVFGHLLRHTHALDKMGVGIFLGFHEPKCLQRWIREAYFGTFDFRGQQLDDSLRCILEAFQLPKEAQQIDRIMESFANVWFDHNPKVLLHADAVYSLSFSLIMLNVDAHNTGVKKKMTLDGFITNNRGINMKQDVPRPMLERLYQSIKAREIKISGMSGDGEIGEALWMDLSRSSATGDKPRYWIRLDAPTTTPTAAASPAPAIIRSGSVDQKQTEGGLQRVRTINLDENLLLEMWQSAMAALTVVWDMCELKETAKKKAAAAASGAGVEGAAKLPTAKPIATSVESKSPARNGVSASPVITATAGGSAAPLQRLDSGTVTPTPTDDEDGSGGVLSAARDGLFSILSVAAAYRRTRRIVVPEVMAGIAKLTGLLQNFRDESNTTAGVRATEENRRDSALEFFGTKPKAQRATKLLFSVARRFGSCLGAESWRLMLSVTLQLLLMDALPAHMLVLHDFVGWHANARGRASILSFAPEAKASDTDSEGSTGSGGVTSIFSKVTSYFAASSTQPAEAAPKSARQIRTEQRAKDCVAACNVPSLFAETTTLSASSVQQLVFTLIDFVLRAVGLDSRRHTKSKKGGAATATAADSSASNTAAASTPLVAAPLLVDEKDIDRGDVHSHYLELGGELRQVLFCINLLTSVLIANHSDADRARLAPVWPAVSQFFDAVFGAPTIAQASVSAAAAASAPSSAPKRKPALALPSPVVEASVVALWKLLTLLWTPTAASASLKASGGDSKTPLRIQTSSDAAAAPSASSVGGVTERDELFARVRWLAHVDWRHRHVAQQTMEGMKSFIEIAGRYVHSASHWQQVFQLLTRATRFPYCFGPAFQTLCILLTTTPSAPPTPVAASASAAGAAAVASLPQPQSSVTLACLSIATFSPAVSGVLTFARSRLASASVAVRCVELLLTLHNHLHSLLTRLAPASNSAVRTNGPAPTAVDSKSDASDEPVSVPSAAVATEPVRFEVIWNELWKPLLLGFGWLCLHGDNIEKGNAPPAASDASTAAAANAPTAAPSPASMSVRHHALVALQQILLSDHFAVHAKLHPPPPHAARSAAAVVSSPSAASPPSPKNQAMTSRPALASDVLTKVQAGVAAAAAAAGAGSAPPSTSSPLADLLHSVGSSAAPISFSLSPVSPPDAYALFWQLCLDELLFPLWNGLADTPALIAPPVTSNASLTSGAGGATPASASAVASGKQSRAAAVQQAVAADLARARTLTTNLVCKLFLRHLTELRSRTHFHLIWLNILATMEKYTRLGTAAAASSSATGTPNRPTAAPVGTAAGGAPVVRARQHNPTQAQLALVESVHESLKNLILVMSAAGVFDPQQNSTGKELWDVTWAVVDPFCPTMKAALFPPPKVAAPPPVATGAPTATPATATATAAPAPAATVTGPTPVAGTGALTATAVAATPVRAPNPNANAPPSTPAAPVSANTQTQPQPQSQAPIATVTAAVQVPPPQTPVRVASGGAAATPAPTPTPTPGAAAAVAAVAAGQSQAALAVAAVATPIPVRTNPNAAVVSATPTAPAAIRPKSPPPPAPAPAPASSGGFLSSFFG